MNYCPNCGHRMPKDQKDEPVVGGCAQQGMTAREIMEAQDVPWYFRLVQFSTATNPPNVRETATELMMLGELGKTKEQALSMTYRSTYGASMTAVEIDGLS